MVKDNNEIYRKLRQEINKMPIAFPETNSGVEIRLLKYLFTPEEAEIAVHLNIVPEDLKRIHNRLEKKGITISIDDLEKTLDNMVIKGAILGGRIFESLKGDKKHYSLNQLAIGMFESQADRLTPEYARDFFSYFDDQFYKDFYGTKTAQMRTVPISVSLKPQLHVEPYNNIRDYIKNLDDDIVVMNCVCRQARDARGHPCTHSDIRETCFSFGDVARFFLGKGTGRAITSQEALQILDKAEEAGFVLQPENNRKPLFMCCCCRDCCHVLRGFKLHARPADLFHTNYFSKVDPVKCNGCTLCEKKCAMEAIKVEDEIAHVNLDRCLGCGVCVSACKHNALSLCKKDTVYVPPKNHDVMYQKIMVERFGIAKTMKTVMKVLVGAKA